jgi:hypothetical protein
MEKGKEKRRTSLPLQGHFARSADHDEEEERMRAIESVDLLGIERAQSRLGGKGRAERTKSSRSAMEEMSPVAMSALTNSELRVLSLF